MNLNLTTQMRTMMIQTAVLYDVPAHRLVSPGKEKRITAARRAWFFNLAIAAGYSYSEIGLRTGFDHTSVMYGVRKRSAELYGTAPKAPLADIRAAYNATNQECGA